MITTTNTVVSVLSRRREQPVGLSPDPQRARREARQHLGEARAAGGSAAERERDELREVALHVWLR